ncbi:MAG TPA: thioredoxin family protein [Thermoanaerobaculia bacterium]|nr:thioredoxin family protein [Thermoanaerobaculia bacterium]
MKRGLLVLLVLLLSPGLFAATWYKTLAEAQAVAKQKNQLIFVDLFANWCGWCHRMEREVFPSEKFQNATKEMVLLRLDTEDRGEGTRFSLQYGIRSLPTFLLLDKDLMIAGVITGYAPADPFSARVIETVGKYEDFRQRLKEEPKNLTNYPYRLELARDLISRRAWNEGEKRLKGLIDDAKTPADVRALARYNLAISLLNQKQYDASATTLKKLLSEASAGEMAEKGAFLLGQVYLEQGRYPESLAELKRFKDRYPQSSLIENVNVMIPQLEKVLARP